MADVLSLSGGYWYNEEIFEQAGIDSIPGTWNEFLDMCETLRGWSKEQGQGVCPLQASGEGYLYFADHILADRRKELAEMTQDGLMRQQGTELEEIAGRLKNIYRFSGSVIPDRQGYVLPEGIKGKRFPDPFFILFQPDGM